MPYWENKIRPFPFIVSQLISQGLAHLPSHSWLVLACSISVCIWTLLCWGIEQRSALTTMPCRPPHWETNSSGLGMKLFHSCFLLSRPSSICSPQAPPLWNSSTSLTSTASRASSARIEHVFFSPHLLLCNVWYNRKEKCITDNNRCFKDKCYFRSSQTTSNDQVKISIVLNPRCTAATNKYDENRIFHCLFILSINWSIKYFELSIKV